MRSTIFTLIAVLLFTSLSAQQEWKYLRPTNTGLPGDYVQAIAIDDWNRVWTTGYEPFWSDGSVAVYNDTVWKCWSNFEGYLPDDRVNQIVFDQNNHVWVATDAGVATFNGQKWTKWDTSSTTFPGVKAISITVDTANNIWVCFRTTGSVDGGLAKYDGQAWTMYNVFNSSLPTADIGVIKGDPDGSIWIASSVGLLKFDGLNFIQYNSSNSGISGPVLDIDIDDKGHRWFLTSSGLDEYDGTNWTYINSQNSPVQNFGNLYDLDVEGDQIIIGAIGFGTSGAYIFDGQSWSSHFSPNHVYDVAIDHDGHFWMGGIGFLMEYANGNWKTYTKYNTGLTDYFPEDIFIDSRNERWIATGNGGINRMEEPRNWWLYNNRNEDHFPNPIPYTTIGSAVAETPDGTIWMAYDGTYGGVVEFDRSSGQMNIWEIGNSGVNLQSIECIYGDRFGRVWVGLKYGGVSMYDGNSWVQFDRNNSALPTNEIHSFKDQADGTVWIGTYYGLARFNGTTIDTAFTPDLSDLQGGLIRDIEIDSSGRLLLATNEGLEIVDGGSWSIYNESNSGIVANNITGVEIAEDQTIWVSGHNTYTWPYYGGVSHFDGTSWITYRSDNSPVAHKQVEDIELDDYGNLWMLTQSMAITIYRKGGLRNIDTTTAWPLPPAGGIISGLSGSQQLPEFSIYPNPARDNIRISDLSLSRQATVIISDLTGRTLYQETIDPSGGKSISIRYLPAGQYLLTVREASSVQTQSFIKIK